MNADPAPVLDWADDLLVEYHLAGKERPQFLANISAEGRKGSDAMTADPE